MNWTGEDLMAHADGELDAERRAANWAQWAGLAASPRPWVRRRARSWRPARAMRDCPKRKGGSGPAHT